MKSDYLFLGFAISNCEMEKILKIDKFPAIQTHKFIWNFIRGIEYENKISCTYISAEPVSDYPFYPEKKIKFKIEKENIFDKNIQIISIPFYNTTLLKILTRFLSSFYYSIRNYHKKDNKGGVIVYSVHIPFMLTGLLISKIYKIPYIGIWTDPPSIVTDRESKIKSKLRNIELKISKFLMRRADKLVVLTKFLAEDFAPKTPYIVIEGIIDSEEKKEENEIINKLDTKNKKIVYTGSLEKRYGIENIVEGFSLIKSENIILEIYGRGDYEEELKKICERNQNIKYFGFVSNSEILKIQKNADFLINARSPKEEYVKYSFPSKTLEYMLSGTPLISTILPGIPEEYREYIYVLKDNSPESIARKIENCLDIPIQDLKKFGEKAKKFAKTKNYKEQGKKIIELIFS